MEELPELDGTLVGLADSARRIDSKHDIDSMSLSVLHECASMTGAQGGSMYVREGDAFVLRGSLDPGHALPFLRLPLPPGCLLSKVEKARRPLLVEDVAADHAVKSSSWTGYADGTALLFPVVETDGSTAGIISLHNKRDGRFDRRDLELGGLLALLCRGSLFALRHAAAVHAAEERHRMVFDHSHGGVMILEVTSDMRFKVLEVNPAIERLTGIQRDRALGRFVDELLPRPDAEKLIANYRRCVESGMQLNVEGPFHLPAGVRHISSTLIPIHGTDGHVRELIALPMDLTGQAVAEAALVESEARYRQIFENSSDGIFVLDAVGDNGQYRVAAANPAMERLTGVSLAAASGRLVDDIFPEPVAQTVRSDIKRCVAEGRPIRTDNELDLASGHLFLQTTLVPLRESDGKVTRIIGVSRDVSAAMLAQHALRQSEEKFSKAFHASPDSISISRLSDGVILEINEGFTRINGYSREDAIGRSSLPGDLDIWADGEQRSRLTALLRQHEEVVDFEATFRRRDGTFRYAILSCRSVEIDGERCLLTISRDLTEERRMQLALRESEALYREIFENASDAIFMVEVEPGPRFRLLSMNPAQERMLGITAASAIGRYNEEYMPSEMATIVNEENRQCIAAGRPMSFQGAVDLQPGHHFYYTTMLIPIKNENGSIVRLIGVKRDETERVEARRREREHEQHLFHAAKLASLGTLVSGIAHEINNPNNFIRLNSQNLKLLWPEVREVLDEIVREGGDMTLHGIPYESAREMIGDLLNGIEEGSRRIERLLVSLRDYVRGDEGDLTDSVDLNSVVDSAVMITADLIRKSTDAFEVETSNPVPKIRGNYHQIEQVLMNLMTNACQSLPSKEKRIAIRTGYDPESDRVTLQVEDEGSGIAPEHLEQVTDPFFTTKQGAGGTGLGLAVSARIIANHGGSMSFSSELGRGTVATVRWPTMRDSP